MVRLWNVPSVCLNMHRCKRPTPVFSNGAPPLFRQALHVIDQSDQVILSSYPSFFHAVFETGRTKAIVRLHALCGSGRMRGRAVKNSEAPSRVSNPIQLPLQFIPK